MSFVETETRDGIAALTLARGKVNAINAELVAELRDALGACERDGEVRAVMLTGAGKFFSFGFDIPEFLSYDKVKFARFLVGFTDLYTTMFMYPKPLVAAINGHAVAGGCMLALACDIRVMVRGKARISLNEITFGSSVFAGSAEMLRFAVGNANASRVLISGAMYGADEAVTLGLVDIAAEDAVPAARAAASDLAARAGPAFANMKKLLRANVAEEMRRREPESIREFVEIWYSAPTWANLQNITIR